ncbi:MAG: hypothetical protein ABUK13_02760, partial [Gammaproteobacteria bacterium]
MATELNLEENAYKPEGAGMLGAYEPASIDSAAPTVDFDPAAPTKTTQGASAYAAPEYTPPEQAKAGDTAGYDTSGLLGESVADINKLTDPSGALMKDATTRGKQFAAERGLLSSSMAAGAVEKERLGVVMPLVQQMAQERSQVGMQKAGFGQEATMAEFDAATAMGLSQQDYEQQTLLATQSNTFNTARDKVLNDFKAEQSGLDRELQVTLTDTEIAARMGLSELEYEHQVSLSDKANAFTAAENALGRSHEAKMQIADDATRTKLVNLEQKWNQAIQQDVNVAAFWQSSIDGLMDIMNNPDLEPEQMRNAMNEMVGYTDAENVYHIGTVEAGLNFLSGLSGFSGGDGTTGVNTVGMETTTETPTSVVADNTAAAAAEIKALGPKPFAFAGGGGYD